MREELLRIENVSKTVENVVYLDNINFHMYKGEIMGLIPLNNHGKDMLIQLIHQNSSIDFGRIYFDGNLVNYYEYSNFSNNQVYIIDKDAKLIEDLNIADNIYVLNDKFEEYVIRQDPNEERINKVLNDLKLNIQSNQLILELSIFEKTIVEFLKAITTGAKLIILNEISSFLSVEQLLVFHDLIKVYSKRGISFLYMGNHHEEVFNICDRACLFEYGRVIKIIDKKDFSDEIIKPYIIDFDIGSYIREGGVLDSFEFKNLTSLNLNDLSFYVRKGECITILDINNKGIQDIAKIINGDVIPSKGEIILEGIKIENFKTKDMLSNNICLIPENPVEEALFYNMNYMENLTFLFYNKFRKGLINKKSYNSIIEKYKDLLGDELYEEDIINLNRKSLYKLVYYRTLLVNPKIVFIMQPFSNADMYLRSEIIKLINALKESGIAVVILAVNISDTLFVSDALLLMEEGKIVKGLKKEMFLSNNRNF